jgi:hypothetical protein
MFGSGPPTGSPSATYKNGTNNDEWLGRFISPVTGNPAYAIVTPAQTNPELDMCSSATTCGSFTYASGSFNLSTTLGLGGGLYTTFVSASAATWAAVSTVASSATPVFNTSLGNTLKNVLTANVTSSTLTNPTTGQQIMFSIIQDGTGGRTFVWPTTVVNPPSVNLAANSETDWVCKWDGTNCQPLSQATVADFAGQTSAITTTTLATPGAVKVFEFSGTINCTGTSSAATATLTLGWTDTSSTAQSLTAVAACTTLGTASLADTGLHLIRAKGGTNVTYAVAIASTPTYDVSVRLMSR